MLTNIEISLREDQSLLMGPFDYQWFSKADGCHSVIKIVEITDLPSLGK